MAADLQPAAWVADAAWLPRPCLALVTSLDACNGDEDELVRRVAAALDGGVALVQLREKRLPAARLLAVAERLRALTVGRALLFVNDRVDVALACNADGVHLGEDSLPIGAARGAAGGRLLVSRAVHDPDAAARSEAEGADLLVVGTVFASQSHPGGATGGTALLDAVRRRVRVPFLAIGGITAANADSATAAGAAGAVVITALLADPDPAEAARSLIESMRRGMGRTAG